MKKKFSFKAIRNEFNRSIHVSVDPQAKYDVDVTEDDFWDITVSGRVHDEFGSDDIIDCTSIARDTVDKLNK